MAGTLCVSFSLVWLLVRWCQNSWTIQTPERCGKEVVTVLLLGIIVLLLFGYLVYALTHPERF